MLLIKLTTKSLIIEIENSNELVIIINITVGRYLSRAYTLIYKLFLTSKQSPIKNPIKSGKSYESNKFNYQHEPRSYRSS